MENASKNIDAFIILLGNEKGGTGKTTISMHLLINLLYDGLNVSSIDLDPRQKSFSRYIENRRNYIIEHSVDLPFPSHFVVNNSKFDNIKEITLDEERRLLNCLHKAADTSDVIIIDSPGNCSNLSRIAHSYADLIITPINDSFIDLDVIGHVNDNSLKLEKPGVYSEMIWEAKVQRARRTKDEISWIVIRNRLTNIDAHNKHNMTIAVQNMAQRLGFFIAEGLAERVIYRELFLKGLTLLDIFEQGIDMMVRPSHLAARSELRDLIDFLDIKARIESKAASRQEDFSFNDAEGQVFDEYGDMSKEQEITSYTNFTPNSADDNTKKIEEEAITSLEDMPAPHLEDETNKFNNINQNAEQELTENSNDVDVEEEIIEAIKSAPKEPISDDEIASLLSEIGADDDVDQDETNNMLMGNNNIDEEENDDYDNLEVGNSVDNTEDDQNDEDYELAKQDTDKSALTEALNAAKSILDSAEDQGHLPNNEPDNNEAVSLDKPEPLQSAEHPVAGSTIPSSNKDNQKNIDDQNSREDNSLTPEQISKLLDGEAKDGHDDGDNTEDATSSKKEALDDMQPEPDENGMHKKTANR